MRKALLGLAIVGMIAMPALAEVTSSNAIPMPGTWSAPTSFGSGATGGEMVQLIPDGSVPPVSGFGTDLYDNIPTFWGGTGTGNYVGYRWNGTFAGWGDDMHGMPASQSFTHIQVGYLATATGVNPMTMWFHNAPGLPHPASTAITALSGTVAINAAFNFPATGFYLLTINLATPIHVNAPGWMSFRSASANRGYWLTGGTPGIGTSHQGLLYDFHTGSGYWVPGLLGSLSSVNGNVGFSIGHAVPEPTTIVALALGGLLALRRRRA